MSVRSSGFATQCEGESHGNERGMAVPLELRARRIAGAPKPPAEACDQTDGLPKWLEEEFRHLVIAPGGGMLAGAVALATDPRRG